MRARQFVAALLSVLAIFGTSAGQTPDSHPELVVEIQPSRLSVYGVVSSVAHERILRDTATRLYADRIAEFSVEIQLALPPGWALVSDLTLQALAETRSSTTTIGESGISVRGFVGNTDRWAKSVNRIIGALPEGWTFDQQVEKIAAMSSINRQCIEMFRTAMRGRKIEFGRASTILGTASSPLLDELIQIAADCPDSLIDVSGHTDSTGDASVNLALSQARADAVAAYLVAGGIAKKRIIATGVGSTEPLTEETSAQSRQLNRRIEVELRFP